MHSFVSISIVYAQNQSFDSYLPVWVLQSYSLSRRFSLNKCSRQGEQFVLSCDADIMFCCCKRWIWYRCCREKSLSSRSSSVIIWSTWFTTPRTSSWLGMPFGGWNITENNYKYPQFKFSSKNVYKHLRQYTVWKSQQSTSASNRC